MIKIIDGDLLQAKEDIIGHQVNCMGVMGAGLALQIKRKYPKVFKVYKELVTEAENANSVRFLLGKSLVVESEGKYIANLFGQYTYGKIGQYTLMNALENALKNLKSFALQHDLTVALPYNIGAGLAGGDWDEILALIERVFEGNEDILTLYRYKG